jgi:glutamyl-tRNA synthetase
LVKEFSLEKIHKAGAVFDWKKLDNINGQYIRALDGERLHALCLPFLEEAHGTRLHFFEQEYIRKAVEVERDRMKKLSDVVEGAALFFSDSLQYEKDLLFWKKTVQNNPVQVEMITTEVLRELHTLLSAVKESKWDTKHLESELFDYIAREGMTNGEVLWPLRTALSGQSNSPGPFEIMNVLGKEKSLARITGAINRLV